MLFLLLASSARTATTLSTCTSTRCAASHTATAAPTGHLAPSRSFVEQALCVHSGWHWSSRRPRRGARPEYRLAGAWWWRTYDVPDGWLGGSGEGSWRAVSGSYGGGLQFTLGTWNRAAGLSHGRVPYAASTGAIAAMSPATQIAAASLIVAQDGGSWREWPQTSRACGYR